MAAETNGATPGPAIQEAAKPAGPPADPTNPAAAATGPAPTPEKLTPAQLKAKAKAEKAARRAQVKEARVVTPAVPPPTQDKGAAADGKAGKGKGKQDGQQTQGKGGQPQAHRPSVSGRRPEAPAPPSVVEKDVRSGIPLCFSHVPMARRSPTSLAHRDVHPAVLLVGQQMATFALNDSVSRLKATFLAFRKVGHAALCTGTYIRGPRCSC